MVYYDKQPPIFETKLGVFEAIMTYYTKAIEQKNLISWDDDELDRTTYHIQEALTEAKKDNLHYESINFESHPSFTNGLNLATIVQKQINTEIDDRARILKSINEGML